MWDAEFSSLASSDSYLPRAIRHEAGHLAASIHLGFVVERVFVQNGSLRIWISLDDPTRQPQERFIVLAAGIAAERFFYSNHDIEGCRKDEQMVAERGGGPIMSYLTEAKQILHLNSSRLRNLVRSMSCRMVEERGSAAFEAGATLSGCDRPSFELLSPDEIQRIWC